MITAPYNFVPLNKEVFYPEWSEQVSHDVPFSDGESGEIDVTITAKSPIFIRDHEKPEQFCQHNGEYYIPATSVKGMVRNVLEIMSFSKMRAENFNDNTYAIRDLSKADNFYMSEMKKPIFGGWLKKDGNSYTIEDCGEVGRIRHEEIDKALNIEFAKYFKEGKFQSTNQQQKTAEYKYGLINHEFKTVTLSEQFKSKTNAKYDSRVFYNFLKDGKNRATLVLTGQPTPRKNTGKMGDGKGYEFLFFDVKSKIEVSEEAMENFKFAYFDGRKTEPKESPDWTYWKQKLQIGEKIPVFFQKDGTKVKHFGLSYLYKLPYNHSVKRGIPPSHFESEDLDLAQIIFGYISKNNKEALKGRVQFSHFKAIANITPLDLRTEILGTPRASYYPIYVKQRDGKLFATFMDENFEIAGRKRYPIHHSNQTTKTTDTGNLNVGTKFKSLKEGVIFKGKVRFHNLKKCEIGALLSALTFHNTPKTFHNIGLAKSLGYGKIELKLDGLNDINSYLKAFELKISEQIPNWSISEQLKELLSMAVEQKNEGNSKLKYLELPEFAKNKTGNNKDYLRNYSKLDNMKAIAIKSLLSDDERKSLLVKKDEILKQREEKARQEAEAKKQKDELEANIKKMQQEFELASSTDNIQVIKNYISKYPDGENAKFLEAKLDKLQEVQMQNKFAEVNKTAKELLDKTLTQTDRKKKKEYLGKFVDKWGKEKENKGSEFVLELVKKAKEEASKL